MMKRIGLMTSGGDAPGMNACIRAVAKRCINLGVEPIGFEDGYQGILESRYGVLDFERVNNIIQLGGTVLGTARCEEYRTSEGIKKAIQNLTELKIDGLICIGGDGTFRGATELYKHSNIPVIGIPGTIDNDIYGTDHTIGYDTALNTVVSCVDRIRDTAGSHHRIFFIEVMGRDAGFIALNSAIASGAESVLIPEEITDIDKLARDLKGQNKGNRSSIVIVAEGDDGGGARQIMKKVSPLMEDYSLRYSILGHLQRGGSPSAFDRILATSMGAKSVELIISGEYNIMIGSQGDFLKTLSIEEAVKTTSSPNMEKLNLLENLRTT